MLQSPLVNVHNELDNLYNKGKKYLCAGNGWLLVGFYFYPQSLFYSTILETFVEDLALAQR